MGGRRGRGWRAIVGLALVASVLPHANAAGERPTTPAGTAPTTTSSPAPTTTTSAPSPVGASADGFTPIDIVKRVDTDAAAPGEPFTFTLVYQCSISPRCAAMEIVDVLPPELRFVEARGAPVTVGPDGRTVTFALGDRQPGFEGQARIVTEFAPGTPDGTVVQNQAELRAGGTEPVRSNAVEVRAVGRSSWELTKRPAGRAVPQLDVPFTYRVRLAAAPGSTQALDGAALVDRLPPGVRFVSATAGGTYDAGAHTVRWELGTVAAGGGVEHDVTVLFPSPAFAVGDRVVNEVEVTGTPRGATPTTVARATSSLRLQPAGALPSIRKVAEQEDLRVGVPASFSIVVGNPGARPLDGVVVADELPAALRPAAGGANLTGTDGPVQVRWRADRGSLQAIVVSTAANGRWEATLPASAAAFEVRYPTLAPGARAEIIVRAGSDGLARDGTPLRHGATIRNCATATAGGSGGSRRSCADQRLVVVDATLTKSLEGAGEPMRPSWRLDIAVAGDSPRPLRDPSIAECLPSGLTLVRPEDPAAAENLVWPSGWPAPTASTGTCPGGTLVTWRFDGLTLAPGAAASLAVNTVVDAAVPGGTVLVNRAELTSLDHERPVAAEDRVAVADDTLVTGRKEARTEPGGPFVSFPEVATVRPGGQVTYRLTVTNRGRVPVTGIQLVDLLPAPGDRGVVSGAPRGSEWAPVFSGVRQAPDGAVLTGSSSPNPCRFEVTAGCDDPGWAPLPAGPAPSVAAIRAELPGVALAPGASLVFEWDVDVPAGAPPGAAAWNSFGYESRRADTGEALRPTEPNPVGVRVAGGEVLQTAALRIRKLVDGQEAAVPPGPGIVVGAPVQFSFEVTNTGTVPVVDIVVTDNVLGPITCPSTSLSPGGSMVCLGPPHVAEEGIHQNLAEVTGRPILGDGQVGPPIAGPTAPAHYTGLVVSPGRSQASITLLKTVNGLDTERTSTPRLAAGQAVRFDFTIRNNGQVTLSDVTLRDDRLDLVSCTPALPARLPARETVRCWAQRPVSEAQHRNVAVVRGVPPGGGPVETDRHEGRYVATGTTGLAGDPPPELPDTGLGTLALAGLGAALAGLGALFVVIGRTSRRVAP